MQDQPTALIPLMRYADITGYAEVDRTDFDRVSQRRWYKNSDGYAAHAFKENGRDRTMLLHRFILGLEIGDPRNGDHINGDPLDNRRSNLRFATRAQNAQNRKTTRHPARTSRYRGVGWDRNVNKWRARVTPPNNGRKAVLLGYFEVEEDAARAASEYRARHLPYTVEERGDIR